MSDVKRYEHCDHCDCYGMSTSREGEWVQWDDYEALLAENARLKAEVERLRKAIDDADDKLKLLAEWAVVCEVESGQVNEVRDILRNAAKEGKSSV